jgi:hypothetical protein
MQNSGQVMKNRKILVFVAMQRTGTSAFHRALTLTTKFAACYEVCFPLTPDVKIPDGVNAEFFIEANFHRWLVKFNNQKASWDIILDAYFQYLEGAFPKEFVSLDFKYGQVSRLERLIGAPTGGLIEFLKRQKIPVIHIVRGNGFKRYLSNVLTSSQQKASYTKNESREIRVSINVDTDSCLRDIDRYCDQVTLYKKQLSGYEHLCNVNYETLFLNRSINDGVRDFINDELLAGLGSLVTDNIVTPVNYQKCLANKQEILNSELYERYPEMVNSVL